MSYIINMHTVSRGRKTFGATEPVTELVTALVTDRRAYWNHCHTIYIAGFWGGGGGVPRRNIFFCHFYSTCCVHVKLALHSIYAIPMLNKCIKKIFFW